MGGSDGRTAVDDTPPLELLLRDEPALWRGSERHARGHALASGFDGLDRALPGGGWRVGGVTELLCDDHGIGEFSLLMPALAALTRAGRWTALVNPPHRPYAPALVTAGVDPARLLVIECPSDTEALWATEQLLRGGFVALVILHVTRTSGARQRRLQLAAERGTATAIVHRPGSACAEASPVSARLVLARDASGLRLDLVKARGGRTATLVLAPDALDRAQRIDWPLGRSPARPTNVHPLAGRRGA